MKKPERPEFPQDWYRHCPKVKTAKRWYKKLATLDDFDEEEHAQCEFKNAGNGKECVNCSVFLRRPFLGVELDKKFLPKIEEYYKKLEVYEEEMKKWHKEQKKNKKKETIKFSPICESPKVQIDAEVIKNLIFQEFDKMRCDLDEKKINTGIVYLGDKILTKIKQYEEAAK